MHGEFGKTVLQPINVTEAGYHVIAAHNEEVVRPRRHAL